MADAEELMSERRDLLSVSARIIALGNANLILSIVLGMLARASHNVDFAPIIRAALDRYEDAAGRHDFAVGLTDGNAAFSPIRSSSVCRSR